MYGPKILGASSAVTGATTLAVTGDNKVLFVTGASMLVLGVATFLISTIVSSKN